MDFVAVEGALPVTSSSTDIPRKTTGSNPMYMTSIPSHIVYMYVPGRYPTLDDPSLYEVRKRV